MKSKIFIPLFLSNLLLLFLLQPAKGCGFYETEADYQAMMFLALLPGMKCLRPFTYTMNSFYYQPNYESLNTDPDENDRYRNCMEWLAACDKSVSIEDIYTIQYNTDGNFFIKASETSNWNADFSENSFVKFLIRKENKDLLDYMLFAKQMELTETVNNSGFEEWDDYNRYGSYYHGNSDDEQGIDQHKKELLKTAWEKLKKSNPGFLQQRYALQVCRLQYQIGELPEMKGIDVYTKYFGNVNPKSLMSVWGGLFYAMSTSPSSEDRYRYFIRVFANSDEKKMRCVQLFDDRYDPDSLTQSEQSIALVMLSLRNPGRVLEQIRNAYRLDKSNPYIPFLVVREINKLEDWIITPLFYGKYSITNEDPFRCAYYDSWLEGYKKEHPEEYSDDETGKNFRSENLSTDMQYLAGLKILLDKILLQSNNESHDFYAAALAHISLLQENASGARNYLSMISKNANPTIRLQRNLEAIWLGIKTQDINSESFRKIFLENIADLEKVSTPGYENHQMLYAITLSLANEYLKKGNRVYGNLMRLKSDVYHHPGGDDWHVDESDDWYMENRNGDNYVSLMYFDRNATVQDMDELIALLQKTDKTPFEKFLSSQPLCSINGYKDLKGTIAFRNNDLALAYSTFASMPANYWQSDTFSFTSYLNEDPFLPKGLKANKYRNFDYKFNKAGFVKELINLQNQLADKKIKHADSYIKLGNAFFNTSYWGNSWMMVRYGSSVSDEYYSKVECLPQWMRDYMTADIARKYYEKALQEADNDEQRAYASLMLHHIHLCCHQFLGKDSEEMLAFQYGNRFMQFKNTEIFREYECPGIKSFLSKK